jgi:hypothetical protein
VVSEEEIVEEEVVEEINDSEEEVIDDAGESSGGGGGDNHNPPPVDPVFSATINRTTHTFSSSLVGDDFPPGPQIFTITNTGNQELTGITLNTAGIGIFTIVSGLSQATIPVGGTATFSVQPDYWHSPDNYTGTVIITGNNGISFSVNLSFTVKTRIDPSIDITVPAAGQVPDTIATCAVGSTDYTIGTVSWDPNHDPFQAGTQYTATVTLTAADGFGFARDGTLIAEINGDAVNVIVTNNTGTSVTLSFVFNT